MPDTTLDIDDWYGNLSSRRVDLVGDYAGSELFVVHGESLLLKCFEDPSLDFGDGFQLLHAVYLVESVLFNLKRRKCNFHVVFFDSQKNNCVPAGTSKADRNKFLLTRLIIIHHLQRFLADSQHDDVRVHIFHDIRSADFNDYLQASGAYFLMLHDGASPKTANQRSSEGEEYGKPSKGKSPEVLRLRTNVHVMLAIGYNVALINGMSFQDTKVGSRTLCDTID